MDTESGLRPLISVFKLLSWLTYDAYCMRSGGDEPGLHAASERVALQLGASNGFMEPLQFEQSERIEKQPAWVRHPTIVRRNSMTAR